jgi:hypothetical protein
MSEGSVVIDYPETIFGVFAARARRRSSRSLTHQTVACALTAVSLLALFPTWWPVSAALATGACYAVWGVLDRRRRPGLVDGALRALAALTAVLALVTVVGLGLAAFTGDGRSPYGTCFDANGRAFACNARGERR